MNDNKLCVVSLYQLRKSFINKINIEMTGDRRLPQRHTDTSCDEFANMPKNQNWLSEMRLICYEILLELGPRRHCQQQQHQRQSQNDIKTAFNAARCDTDNPSIVSSTTTDAISIRFRLILSVKWEYLWWWHQTRWVHFMWALNQTDVLRNDHRSTWMIV